MSQAKIQVGVAQKMRASMAASKSGNAPVDKQKIGRVEIACFNCRQYSHNEVLPSLWLNMFFR